MKRTIKVIKNKIIINAYYSVLDTVFLPLLMLIVTPIFISKLGIEYYGIWMLINSLVVAMSILNIGGVDTVIKYISHYKANNDENSINEIFGTVFITQLIFTFFIALLSFYLPLIITRAGYFKFNGPHIKFFEGAFQFGILLFALKLIEQITFAYFKGIERYDISSILSIISKFLLIITQVVTVVFSRNLITVFTNSFFLMVFLVPLELFFIIKYTNSLKLISTFTKKRFFEIFHFTKWSWIISLIGTASGQIDRWLVGGLSDMKSLGYYSLALLVFNHIHSITASSVSWIFPKTSNLRNTDKMMKYFFSSQAFVILFSLGASYILISFDGIFLLWLKQETYVNAIPFIKNMIILLPLYALSILPFYIIKGHGIIKYNFYSNIITLIIRFTLVIIFYKHFQLNGVIMAIGVSGLFLSVYLFNILKKKIFHKHKINVILTFTIPLIYIGVMIINYSYLNILGFITIITIFYYIFIKNHHENIYKL